MSNYEKFTEKYECSPAQLGTIFAHGIVDDFTSFSKVIESEFGPKIALEFFEAALECYKYLESPYAWLDVDDDLDDRIKEEQGDVILTKLSKEEIKKMYGETSNSKSPSYRYGFYKGLQSANFYDEAKENDSDYSRGFSDACKVNGEGHNRRR